jgi:hypothetical protein
VMARPGRVTNTGDANERFPLDIQVRRLEPGIAQSGQVHSTARNRHGITPPETSLIIYLVL